MITGPNPSGLCMCGCGEPTPIAKKSNGGNVIGTPRKYAGLGHVNRGRTGFKSTEERFWAKVDRRGDDECWPWLGYVGQNGQGQFSLTHTKTVFPHRHIYELVVGPIPEGLVIDHLCHTRDPSCLLGNACPHRSCCNPAHLEPVTARVNVLRAHVAPSAINARKTHCINGHEFAGENLILKPNGGRACRECRRAKGRRRQANRRAA